MRRRLLFPVLFIGLAASAWGETIINEAAPQPNAPVRILATFATAEDMGGQVDFKNFSNRAVDQIQVAWVIEVPTSCNSSVAPWVITSPIDMLVLKPGETRSAFSYRINPYELRRFVLKAKAAALHIQVGVVRVEFVANGKTDAPIWTFNLKQNGLSFDDHRQNNAAPCPHSHARRAVFQQKIGHPAAATPYGVAVHSDRQLHVPLAEAEAHRFSLLRSGLSPSRTGEDARAYIPARRASARSNPQ